MLLPEPGHQFGKMVATLLKPETFSFTHASEPSVLLRTLYKMAFRPLGPKTCGIKKGRLEWGGLGLNCALTPS